jgi:hypothetical protein
MTSKKTLLAIPLVAIAVIAIGFGMTSNVFAQPTTSTTPATVDLPDTPNAADKPDGPNGAVDAADNGTDNQKDGEQNDKTELKK